MYKIIHNNVIIDVVKEIRYVRYLQDLKKVVPTSISSAQAICGSDNKTFYALQGVELPAEKSHWKEVTYIKISDNEYYSLKDSLSKHETVHANKNELNLIRNEKICKLSEDCKNAIIDGVTVLLEDGNYYKFRLTIEDQLNLIDIERELLDGVDKVLYHSTNSVCKFFTKNEMLLIIKEASKHKSYHTTYFNLLKYCINNMVNIDDITKIEYGIDLLSLRIPEEIKETVRRKLNG